MTNAIELETYRFAVLQIFKILTGLDMPVKDGVPTDKNIEMCIRRYRAAKESARNCAHALAAERD